MKKPSAEALAITKIWVFFKDYPFIIIFCWGAAYTRYFAVPTISRPGMEGRRPPLGLGGDWAKCHCGGLAWLESIVVSNNWNICTAERCQR